MKGACILKLEMQLLNNIYQLNFPIVEVAISTFSSDKVKSKRRTPNNLQ